MTASPRAPPSQGLPLPGVPGLCLLADCRALGAYLAHDTRWAAVGNRDMSTPISAMSSCAPVLPMPGISSSWATCAANGAIALLDPPGQRLDLGGQRIGAVEHHAQQVAVVVAEMPGQRLDQDALLAAHGGAGQVGQHVRVALPGDQRLAMS